MSEYIHTTGGIRKNDDARQSMRTRRNAAFEQPNFDEASAV